MSKIFPEQTTHISARPDCFHKETFLSHAPVFINRTVVNTVYTPETALSHLHIHDFVEISIVVEGKGIHHTLNQTNECNIGDVYIINQGTPHAYFATANGDRPIVCNLIFNPKDILDGEYACSDHPQYCYGIFRKDGLMAYIMFTATSMKKVTGILDCMKKELTYRKFEWEQALKAYLINFLIMASRYIPSSETALSQRTRKEQLLALSIMRYVLDHYNDFDLTLKQVAESLFISSSVAGRAFRQTMGENFSDYVRRVRLEKASQLLAETKLTNEQIVYACGWRDVPTFYHQFKNHTGLTPLAYRHQNSSELITSAPAQNNMENSQYKKEGELIMSILIEISENLQKGKAKIVAELVQKALDEGVAANSILNDGLLAGMSIIGEKFKNNEVYVPEVLVAARAMNKGTDILKPILAEQGVQVAGKVCIGTVQGDLHDIGKNLVKMMMEGKGLEVVDLGTDVAPETFVQTAIEQNCQVICCSALLTTTMGVMGDVVKVAETAGIRDKVKIMVGGAPVSDEFCKQIGADCYTSDAASAADAAVAFCKIKQD